MVVQTGESKHSRHPDVFSSMTQEIPCPVCSSRATRYALTGTDLLFESTSKIFTLNSCGSCGCLFLNPMPDNEEIAGFYPTQYWWNSAKPGPLKKLEGIYRKLALRGHVSFITGAAGNRTGLDLL